MQNMSSDGNSKVYKHHPLLSKTSGRGERGEGRGRGRRRGEDILEANVGESNQGEDLVDVIAGVDPKVLEELQCFHGKELKKDVQML